MIADRNLYFTSDRRSIVEEGSPDAAFLFVPKGDYYDEVRAKELGWPPAELEVTEKIDMEEFLRKAQEEAEAKALHEPPETKAQPGPRLVKKRKDG